MSQTKKRAQCALSEPDIHLPGWNQKQREDFFEGIRIHGFKKLKKLQRHIGSKTQEDVRIATELYKKEVRNRELTIDMERQIEEAGVTNEDYKTWLYFYMASQSHRGDQLPVAALEAFLDQTSPRFLPTAELTFPNWRRAEIKDFLATIELTKIITNIPQHIPTKTELEITGATDAYTIICDARNHAIENGRHIPTYDELKPGYIYLQCIVAALNDNKKLKNLKIPLNADPDMVRAKFVLKEWLMPDIGALPSGWTKDEKYSLIVAIETYGSFDLLRIQSYFPWKTRTELKSAIGAIRKEVEFKEEFYEKSRSERYLSLASWGSTLTMCTESKQQIAAAKRLISALEELPEPESQQDFMRLYRRSMSEHEMTAAVLSLCMQDAKRKGTRLIPMLEALIDDVARHHN